MGGWKHLIGTGMMAARVGYVKPATKVLVLLLCIGGVAFAFGARFWNSGDTYWLRLASFLALVAVMVFYTWSSLGFSKATQDRKEVATRVLVCVFYAMGLVLSAGTQFQLVQYPSGLIWGFTIIIILTWISLVVLGSTEHHRPKQCTELAGERNPKW